MDSSWPRFSSMPDRAELHGTSSSSSSCASSSSSSSCSCASSSCASCASSAFSWGHGGDDLHLSSSTLRSTGPASSQAFVPASPLPDTEMNSGLLSSPDGSGSSFSDGPSKRPKFAQQSPPLPKSPINQCHARKLGEKITALQELVSPFGKTDTASVLLEAIGYIKFLQEQVHVLSSPYMAASIHKKGCDVKKPDLQSRGLCLVPISCTRNVVANNNGADYWISGLRGCGRS